MLQQQWDDPLANLTPATAKSPVPDIPAVKPAPESSDNTEFETGTLVPDVVSHSSTPTPPPSASGELGTAGLGHLPSSEDAQITPNPLSGGVCTRVVHTARGHGYQSRQPG